MPSAKERVQVKSQNREGVDGLTAKDRVAGSLVKRALAVQQAEARRTGLPLCKKNKSELGGGGGRIKGPAQKYLRGWERWPPRGVPTLYGGSSGTATEVGSSAAFGSTGAVDEVVRSAAWGAKQKRPRASWLSSQWDGLRARWWRRSTVPQGGNVGELSTAGGLDYGHGGGAGGDAGGAAGGVRTEGGALGLGYMEGPGFAFC